MSINQSEKEKAHELINLMKDNLRAPTNTQQKIKERINNMQMGAADTIEKIDFQKNNLGPRDTEIERGNDNNVSFNPTPKPR